MVLLTEAVRGGPTRGFRALAGANLAFTVLLVSLALGLSLVPPGGPALRVLKIVGGAFLLWAAADAIRARPATGQASADNYTLPPAARGALAVLLNPGVWLFLATAASSLLSAAVRAGGTGTAVAAALAMVLGLATGDATVVLLGGFGMSRAGERTGQWVRRTLAGLLAALGVWLVVGGAFG